MNSIIDDKDSMNFCRRHWNVKETDIKDRDMDRFSSKNYFATTY